MDGTQARQTAFDSACRRAAMLLLGAALLLVGYWAAWFGERSLVASAKTSAYYDFEQAFPLADAWLLVAIVLAAAQLLRARPSALAWMLIAGACALYLCGMDVLYNLEHGIYSHGAQGVIELAINVVCLTAGSITIAWAWRNRAPLLARGAAAPA